jgi:hypothetical protein
MFDSVTYSVTYQDADNLPSTDTIARREKIFALQAAMSDLPKYDVEPTHTFAPDSCARTLIIPAGDVVVGKIHKHAHINVIAYGHCMVMTEQEGLLELRGPLVFTSSPGTKRAVYAIEETHWTTVHVTKETDLDKIEEHVIAKSYEEYEQFRLETNKQLQIATEKTV